MVLASERRTANELHRSHLDSQQSRAYASKLHAHAHKQQGQHQMQHTQSKDAYTVERSHHGDPGLAIAIEQTSAHQVHDVKDAVSASNLNPCADCLSLVGSVKGDSHCGPSHIDGEDRDCTFFRLFHKACQIEYCAAHVGAAHS